MPTSTGKPLVTDDEENVFAPCPPVPCPLYVSEELPCPGTLGSDGRNVGDTLTFLRCTSCGLTFVAEDLK